MKRLDLKQIGVQELTTVEQQDVSGGWVGFAIFILGVIIGWTWGSGVCGNEE